MRSRYGREPDRHPVSLTGEPVLRLLLLGLGVVPLPSAATARVAALHASARFRAAGENARTFANSVGP